jgi:acyl-CoA synthetase (AMP-forming)/AMP-acid ligase II
MTAKSNENLRVLLERRAAENAGKIFLFSEADGRRWTYAEFDESVNCAANMLKANGIKKGNAVSLLLPNSAEYIIAYFACWKIGAIANPVNSLLKTEEIEFVVGNSEAKLLIVHSEFQAITENINLRKIVFDDEAVATQGFGVILAQTSLEKDDEAVIIYTSGTTGKPKGCLLTHGNLIANARQITEWLGFSETDRLLTIMPLFHMNAVSVTTMTALYAAASTVVSPKFSASRFWQIIADYKITSFGSVATMLSMLLQKAQSPKPEIQYPKSEIQNPKRFVSQCAVCACSGGSFTKV